MAGSRTLRAAAAVASALVAVLAGELLLAARPEPDAFLSFQAQNPIEARRGLLEAHPARIYALAPGYRARPDHPGVYGTGPWPWRGRPAEPAPAGMLRVAVVGDSCVYGVGLDVEDTLPRRLERALGERGYDPRALQVLNLGVPGYSSAQSLRVVEEALEAWSPELFVLYVGAWNDQAPALGRGDVELLEAERGLFGRSRLLRLMRSAAAGDEARTRLTAGEVESVVGRMLDAIESAGAASILVLPAHPPATLREHPRLAEDRGSVRRAATARGAPLVSAAELSAAAGAAPDELFLDFVHPAPPLWELVVDELAPLAAASLGARRVAPPAAPPQVIAVEPLAVSALGGDRLRVHVAGLAPDAELAVLLGGRPLVDLTRGAEWVEGTVARDAGGRRDVLVQTAGGVGRLVDAVTLVPPRLVLDGTGAPLLHARPGDRAVVSIAVGPPLERGRWGIRGAVLVDEAQLLPDRLSIECGPGGLAPLPGFDPQRPRPASTLQALVLPRGFEPGSPEEVLTDVLELPEVR
ncbi:MAG: GDSL-type esterase/lipase family protein [Planctomycetota bacterium]